MLSAGNADIEKNMYLIPLNKRCLSGFALLLFIGLTGIVSAQTAPPLGSASTFAILGATTVTATSVDTVFGNVGVSPGTAITGFPPAVIENGTQYSGAGSLAGPAQADAQTAYNNLAGQSSPAANNLSGKILGVSPGAISLAPGVYHFNAAAQVTDTLFLADGGNANAVYIFQISTALVTSPASVIIMTSGGVGKNVFWQIGSSATLGDGSTFAGNIIAFTSVTMDPGAFSSGRVFALGGASTVNGSKIQAIAKTWTGNAGTKNWGDAGNWNAIGVPQITDNVDLTGADTIHINTTTYANDLLINNSKVVLVIDSGQSLLLKKILRLTIGTIINKGNLILYGSILDSAALIRNTGTITLQGNVTQYLYGNMFYANSTGGLTFNNGAGVNLVGNLYIYGNLLLNSGQFRTGGTLTLASNADSTGSIDGSGSGTITGTVTMQRYLNAGYGYKYFSSPVSNATVSAFANLVALSASFPNFYSYNESTDTTGFVTDTVGTSPLIPMAGYAADFGSSTAPKLVVISGILNTGAISIAVTNTNRKYTQGFNLVGNPYPSPVNWNAVSGWTRTNLDNAIYYFDTGSTDQYSGTYSTYVNGVSSNGVADSIIASMQGFFVHVTNGTYPVNGTFGANNSVRINSNPYFHRAGLSVRHSGPALIRFGARFQGSAQGDPVVVYLDSASTTEFSKSRDAIKFMNTGSSVPNLYLVRPDHENLAIKAFFGIRQLGNIPLGLEIKTGGMLDLNLMDIQQLPAELEVYLVDLTTGISQNLRQNPVYSVRLDRGRYENRFQLRCVQQRVFASSGF